VYHQPSQADSMRVSASRSGSTFSTCRNNAE
jgi:hypothetical protein